MYDIPAAPVDMQRLAAILRVVAEPKRLRILHMLMEGFQCNCQLGEALGVPPNLVSHHLRALRVAGLVDVERDASDARWVYYSVNRAALEELNRCFGAFFDPARMKARRVSCGPRAEPAACEEAAGE